MELVGVYRDQTTIPIDRVSAMVFELAGLLNIKLNELEIATPPLYDDLEWPRLICHCFVSHLPEGRNHIGVWKYITNDDYRNQCFHVKSVSSIMRAMAVALVESVEPRRRTPEQLEDAVSVGVALEDYCRGETLPWEEVKERILKTKSLKE